MHFAYTSRLIKRQILCWRESAVDTQHGNAKRSAFFLVVVISILSAISSNNSYALQNTLAEKGPPAPSIVSPPSYTFSVKSQSADEALTELAKQANTTLLFLSI